MCEGKPVVRYLTHPEVVIDPSTPVPQWSLSEIGQSRAGIAARSEWLCQTARIISSAERKAIETAEIIASQLGLQFEIWPAMHENDRSATGVLSQTEFEATANQFFAHPEESIRGWERAVDAQTRIVQEVETVLSQEHTGDILLVGHGGVGTLLFCYYSNLAIDRIFDQFPGGGCYFSFLRDTREILHPWRRIETQP